MESFRGMRYYTNCFPLLFLTLWILPIVDLVKLTTPNGTVFIHENQDLLNWPRLAKDELIVENLLGDEGDGNNYFKLLLKDRETVYFGSRNEVHIVNLDITSQRDVIQWNATNAMLCQGPQSKPEYCHNFIRVAAMTSQNNLLLCGTNALRPKCRIYSKELEGYASSPDLEDGTGRCPYTPTHDSVSYHKDGKLYSATVTDRTARDALLYRAPTRTEQHDSQWLNDPHFVKFDDYEDKMYLFFRESAVENINCKKVVFSRVARVCKNDEGGQGAFQNTWTSFFKARLNCSIPGEYPFYFDEMQSMSEIGEGNVIPSVGTNEREKIVYGVFSTAKNSLQGVAVCAFKMQDIDNVFSGPFKEQKTAKSNWLPVKDSDTPTPHPAKSCSNNSRGIPYQTLDFIKSHPLMDKSVSSWNGKPIFVLSSFKFTFVSIAVDWQVPAADGKYYDVIFLGTDDGRVVKYINIQKSGGMEPVVLEDLQLFSSSERVSQLTIHRDRGTLVAVTSSVVKSIPLQRCNNSATCSSCVALRDPYCSWDSAAGCRSSSNGLINVDAGHHSSCPVEKASTSSVNPGNQVPYSTTTKSNSIQLCETCMEQCSMQQLPREQPSCDNQVVKAGSVTAGVLVAAVLCSVIVTLIIGFVIGYRVALYRNKDSALQCKPENNKVKVVTNTYEVGDPPNHLRYSKRNEDVPSTAGTPPKEKQLNVDFKFNSLGKTLNSNVETTIQQPTKVKKVYI